MPEIVTNPEIGVVQRIPRKSGSCTYVLNAVGPGKQGRTTVLHSKAGSIVCLNSSCAGWWHPDPEKQHAHRPCVHTRVVQAYLETFGDVPDDDDANAV